MIKRAFNRLWNDKRGNILAIAAMVMPLVVGAAGLATDTIQWTLWKRQLQRAADSGAIAGVYDRESHANSTSNTNAAVVHDVELNRHMAVALNAVPTVTYPANTTIMTNQVQVVLSVQQRLPFSAIFMSVVPTITATARAASLPAGGEACMQARDTSTTTGLEFSGTADIVMPDCDLFSNSAGSDTSVAKGNSKVSANSVGGVGGIKSSNNFKVGAYRPYSPPMADPLAAVTPLAADMVCGSGSNARLDDTTNFSTLPTGTNCFSALDVGSNKVINVPANFGPIYINGGDARIQGTFNCVGCTIVLTNKTASSPIGNVTSNGNADAKINITAPTSGPFLGVAIYQDRRAADCSNCNKINGNSSSIITGAIYFPSQELDYNGNGNDVATCTMFIGKRLKFTGTSATSNKFKKLSLCYPTGPTGATIRMVRLVG